MPTYSKTRTWDTSTPDSGDLFDDEFDNIYAGLNELDSNITLYGKRTGELFWLDDYTAPSASFPALCLSAADATLDAANWGQTFIDHLRAIPLRYAPTSTNKTAFDVTNWAIATNVATLTFANSAAENALLAGLAEDNLVHGSFTNWRTITLAAAIGDITAGTYAITALSTGSRTISFAFTAANNSGAVTATASFYRHRIVSSTTTARHFAASGRGFFSTDDTSGAEWIGGLRRRDRMQGHYHPITPVNNVSLNLGAGGPHGWAGGGYLQTGNSIGAPSTDGTNGTPRTGSTTHGPGLAAFAYKWAGEYTP